MNVMKRFFSTSEGNDRATDQHAEPDAPVFAPRETTWEMVSQLAKQVAEKQAALKTQAVPSPTPAQPVKLFYLPSREECRGEETGTTEFVIFLSADGRLMEESLFVPRAFSSLDDDRDWPTPVKKVIPFEQLGSLIGQSTDPKAKRFVGLTAENAGDYYNWLTGKVDFKYENH